MKKFTTKRVLASLLAVTLGFTLSACSKSEYNTEAPYGNISGNYATNGSTTLTNKQLYDMLRPGGYNVFYSLMEEIVLQDYLDEISFSNDKDQEEMFELLNPLVFGTDDLEVINDYTQDELDLMYEKLQDSLYTSNITVDPWEIVISEDEVTYPEALFDYFKLNLAKQRFGEEQLTELVDKEFVTEKNEDGEDEEVENIYYISDEDIESYYNYTYMNNQDYNAVIVGFNSLSAYETAMNAAGTLTDSNVDSFFMSLYNNAYSYKTELTTANFDTETIINSDKLANFNSTLSTFVRGLEAGEYTNSYKEFGDKVYMVYRVTEYSDTEWEDLTDEDFNEMGKDKDVIIDEIREELFDVKLTDSFISSQIVKLFEDLIDEDKITINDPVFALIFQNTYSDYEYTTKELTDSANAAVVDGTKISADSVFEKLSQFYGVSTAFEFFTNNALASSDYINELTEDDLEAAQDAFDVELDNYKNDTYATSGITSEFTEEQFLLMMFGYDNEGDVLKYYYEPQQALQYVTSNYDEKYFSLLELVGKNNYYNYFSLDIKHVLLFVDYDLDGNMDDPADFIKELNETGGTELVEKFEQTIVNIYSAIYNEATYLELGEVDALDYLVKAYNQDRTLVNNNDWSTWADVKTSEGVNFNIQMKVEDLGVIDNSNYSSYVSEFSDHVISMYDNLYLECEEEFDGDKDDSDYLDDLLDEFEDYLDQNHLEFIETSTDFSELCMSSFGFHMLLSMDGSIATSAEFLEKNDYTPSGEDSKVYQNITITLNGEEYTKDGYSDTPYPSIDQLMIYVGEMNTDDGIENLKSSTESIINGFYSTFNSRFTNTTFVNYYLYLDLDMNIVFNSEIDENMTTEWFEISKKSLDNYESTASDSNSVYAGMWDLLEELFTEEV